jgi:hypothetical protein
LCSNGFHLERIFLGHDGNQSFFVGTEAFHGFSNSLNISGHIDIGCFLWSVSK